MISALVWTGCTPLSSRLSLSPSASMMLCRRAAVFKGVQCSKETLLSLLIYSSTTTITTVTYTVWGISLQNSLQLPRGVFRESSILRQLLRAAARILALSVSFKYSTCAIVCFSGGRGHRKKTSVRIAIDIKLWLPPFPLIINLIHFCAVADTRFAQMVNVVLNDRDSEM